MTTFLDALQYPTPENVIAATQSSLENREGLGKVFNTFKTEAAAYRAKVAEILSGNHDPETIKAKFSELRKDVFEKSTKALEEEPGWLTKIQENPNDKVAAEALTYYFQLYSDMGFSNAYIDLYNKIPEKAYDVKQSPEIMLDLAYSYNYRTKKNEKTKKWDPNPDPEMALKVIKKLESFYKDADLDYKREYLDPKIAGVKARATTLIVDRDTQDLGEEEAKEFRTGAYKEARDLHLTQFTSGHGYHHYSGYNAMLYSVLLGDSKTANELAPKVYMSAMRDGGLFAADNLTVFRTMMAIVVQPDLVKLPGDEKGNNTIENALAALQKKIVEPAQRTAFVRDINKVLGALGDSPEEQRIKDTLSNVILPGIKMEKIYEPDIVGKDDPRDMLVRNYSYAPATSSVIPGAGNGRGVSLGGNLSKGGLISDLNITSFDYFAVKPLVETKLSDLAEKLGASADIFPEGMRDKTLKELALNNQVGGENGAGQLFEATRILTREIFQTKRLNMENMGSKGHVEFEKGLRALYKLGGLTDEDFKDLSSKTDKEIFANAPTAANVGFLMATRSGDCRMYKVVSGLMSRIASATAQNDVLDQLDKGSISQAEALEQTRNIRRVNLVNFDLDLFGPAKAEDGKWPDRGSHGYFEKNKDGKNVLLEPHSVSLLPQRKPNGEMENLYLTCTFYNGEYRNDKGEIVPGATYDLRVEITRDMIKTIPGKPGEKPQFEIDLTGKTGFKVWDPEANEGKGAAVDAPVFVRPNKYSHIQGASLQADRSAGINDRATAGRVYGPNPVFLAANNLQDSLDLTRAWESDISRAPAKITETIEGIIVERAAARSGPPTEVPPGTEARDLGAQKVVAL